MKKPYLVIISGPSGSGKSTVLNILEDLGFFCVDNLPTTLLPKFLNSASRHQKISQRLLW